ncbi:MAG: ATP synthase F1 subunit delta [Gemmatimonadales bacterium]
MRSPTIARNYAEALFIVATRHREAERYGDLLDAVAGAIAADRRLEVALESPRVPKSLKQQILSRALEGVAPVGLIKFLHAVVKRGRQGLLPEISQEYQRLLDQALNRVHAGVTLAREANAKLQKDIADRLAEVLGKTVIPHVLVDPAILGGVVVKVGDRIYDGSVRRKLQTLRWRLTGRT